MCREWWDEKGLGQGADWGSKPESFCSWLHKPSLSGLLHHQQQAILGGSGESHMWLVWAACLRRTQKSGLAPTDQFKVWLPPSTSDWSPLFKKLKKSFEKLKSKKTPRGFWYRTFHVWICYLRKKTRKRATFSWKDFLAINFLSDREIFMKHIE